MREQIVEKLFSRWDDDIGTDQEFITGGIKIKLEIKRQQSGKQDEKVSAYSQDYWPSFSHLPEHQNNETKTTLATVICKKLPIKQSIYNRVEEETLGIAQPQIKTWITDDTWNLVTQKKELKIQLNNNHTLRLQYQRLPRQVKKAARRTASNDSS